MIRHDALPDIDLRHMLRMTDSTGMLQHARYGVPDPDHGYCVDDNCRALIAAVLYSRLFGYDEQAAPVARYLAFLAHAFNKENGRFRNFMQYDRAWLEDAGSEDSHGRCLWALGFAAGMAHGVCFAGLARELFSSAVGAVSEFRYYRPWCFTLLGIHHFRSAGGEQRPLYADVEAELLDRLLARFDEHASDDWPWCDDILTYDNARIPQALLLAGRDLGRDDAVERGLRALEWLLDAQTAPDGHLSIIGNEGWYPKGGEPAAFDQQPLEACALVDACLCARRVTGDERWDDHALTCFEWFSGRNDLGAVMYDSVTGGGRDGLASWGVNQNQGAESTLAWVLGALLLRAHATKPFEATWTDDETTTGEA